eukprot:gnl/Carplike_NY0171/1450_a1970_1188.p1 GENE.gnl/Carplike_NY0171/1450_a1970_1188~~gnl/Carplike_NY0171/1450_a1970_1188.p1  ORF type:complete len:315 (+),score=73.17 gnl/Carplike_NY0171/1450_a1970_1188:91-945(+)
MPQASVMPSTQPMPSAFPMPQPSTSTPSRQPTIMPTALPSGPKPGIMMPQPSVMPSAHPMPSAFPMPQPSTTTQQPTTMPSAMPTAMPTAMPGSTFPMPQVSGPTSQPSMPTALPGMMSAPMQQNDIHTLPTATSSRRRMRSRPRVGTPKSQSEPSPSPQRTPMSAPMTGTDVPDRLPMRANALSYINGINAEQAQYSKACKVLQKLATQIHSDPGFSHISSQFYQLVALCYHGKITPQEADALIAAVEKVKFGHPVQPTEWRTFLNLKRYVMVFMQIAKMFGK